MHEIREESAAVVAKLGAISIILSAPLWPSRDGLNEQGKILFDLMVQTGKPLALAVAEERWPDAMEIAATWTAPMTAFMDNTYLKDDEQAQRLLAVYKHYMDAVAPWGSL